MAALKKGQRIDEQALEGWLIGMKITELEAMVTLQEAGLLPKLLPDQKMAKFRDALVKAYNQYPSGLDWPNNTVIVIACEPLYNAIHIKEGVFTLAFRML